MYNQATYPKEEIMRLVKEEFFTESELNVLQGFYSLENCEATAPQLAKYLGYQHFSPINSIIGKMGKRIAKELNLPLRKRDNGKEAGWDIICEGEPQKEGFLWKLKQPIKDAFKDLGFGPMEISIAEELPNEIELSEGLKQTILVNKYERNKLARAICLDKYGYKCQVCNFDFEEKYGEIGKDLIHAHHIVPISEIGEEYIINAEKDLIPVCPNCHAMIHRNKNRVLTVNELKEIIRAQENNPYSENP
ncbi:MAG: HNH endonuclease [Weeksellaceae bacterium]